MYNEDFMDLIIKKAGEEKIDIPVCALIVKDDKILSCKLNEKEKTFDPTAHAEILALREASKKLKSWRLNDCDMYVTLEPCPMCTAAIINARIKNLYFGSYDYKFGGFSTSLNLKQLYSSSINVEGGKKEEKCDKILKKYFENLRDKNEKDT